jgi:predicted SnoaL-like aldol condensation-catalyzing enzyme
MRDIIRNGFTTAARELVPGSRQVVIRFFQFVFKASVPDRWKLVRIIERGTE